MDESTVSQLISNAKIDENGESYVIILGTEDKKEDLYLADLFVNDIDTYIKLLETKQINSMDISILFKIKLCVVNIFQIKLN